MNIRVCYANGMELIRYQKRYRIRRAVPGANSLEVTFPFEMVDRKARELGIPLETFLETYSVIAEYDRDTVVYRMELTPK